MSAGQVWQRRDGLKWVEVQATGLEPSGWRLMIPLADPDAATAAPPLVVPIGSWHARVHLAVGVPDEGLGRPLATVADDQLETLRDALAALVARPRLPPVA